MPAKADTEGSFFPNCHFFCDCFEHRTKEHGKNSASPVRDGVEKAEKKDCRKNVVKGTTTSRGLTVICLKQCKQAGYKTWSSDWHWYQKNKENMF